MCGCGGVGGGNVWGHHHSHLVELREGCRTQPTNERRHAAANRLVFIVTLQWQVENLARAADKRNGHELEVLLVEVHCFFFGGLGIE